MPQYLIGVVGATNTDPADIAPEDMKQMIAEVDELIAEATATGVFVFAGGLGGAETATVVDAGSGEVVITDGPYAESKEQMAGFTVLELPDLATAQHWAARYSKACRTPQEVRPIFNAPEMD